MKNRPLAAIDIGTNTFRLIIAKVHRTAHPERYSIKEMYSERRITRIGAGLDENGYLSKGSIDSGISVLKSFIKIISRYDVSTIAAVATSAIREAKNSNKFILRAKAEVGLDIVILSGEEEAGITATGMLIDMTIPQKALLLDIGGGSTELIFISDGTLQLTRSAILGVVYLADKYMIHDPVSDELLNNMQDEVSSRASALIQGFLPHITEETELIGTAGTVTTLAAVAQNLSHVDHDKIHRYTLTIDMINDIYSAIARLSLVERAKYIPFEPERLDIIVPGTLILLTVMKLFHLTSLTVSNYGLREGILVDTFNKYNL